MKENLASQIFGFAVFFASGVLLSAFYDVFRIWRAMFRSEKRAVFWQDVFYMIAAAFFAFLVNLGVNGGEIRLFLVVGGILGWLCWHFTAGLVTVFLFRRLFGFLYRRIFDPVAGWSHRFCLKTERTALQIVVSAKNHIQNGKKRLKDCTGIVYNRHVERWKGRKRLKSREANRNMKVIRGKKRKGNFLLRIAVIAFGIYLFSMLIRQQVTISQKKQQLAAVRQQIQIQEIQNDDLKNAAESGKNGASDYMERAARKGLDYSKPGERVFVNIAGK